MNNKSTIFKSVTQTENPHAENAGLFDSTNLLQRIKTDAEKQSFFDRFKGFYMVLKFVLLPALILYSVITESLFLFFSIHDMTHSTTAAAICTAFFVLLIEAIKYTGGSKIFSFFTQGYFKDGTHYKIFFAFLLPFVLIAFCGSAFFSIKSAPHLSKYIINYAQPFEGINLDDIHSKYNDRITTLQEKQAQAHNTTWKNSITRDAVKLSSKIQESINEIETQRKIEIAQAIKKNTDGLQDHEANIFNKGQYFRSFSGVSEGLYFVVLLLIALFYSNTYKELPSPTLETSSTGIGFKPQTIVKQVKQPVSNLHSTKAKVVVVKDEKYLLQRLNQAHKRSLNPDSRQSTRDNQDRIKNDLAAELETIGYTINFYGEQLEIITPNKENTA